MVEKCKPKQGKWQFLYWKQVIIIDTHTISEFGIKFSSIAVSRKNILFW